MNRELKALPAESMTAIALNTSVLVNVNWNSEMRERERERERERDEQHAARVVNRAYLNSVP